MPLERDGEMVCVQCGKPLTREDSKCFSCGGALVPGPKFATFNPPCAECGGVGFHRDGCIVANEPFRFEVTLLDDANAETMALDMRFALPRRRFDSSAVRRLIQYVAEFRP